MRLLNRRGSAACVIAGLLLTSAGCGSSGAGPATETRTAVGFPVSMTNCEAELTFQRPPERVVSLYPGMTEQLIALGLGERVVAQSGTGQGAPLPEYRDEFERVTALGDGSLSTEVLLAQQADLLLAEGTYHFTGKELPTRESLAERGLPVYVSQPLCPANKTRSTLDDALADFTALGKAFGVPERAAEIVGDFHQRVARVHSALSGREPVPAVVVTVFDDQLYVDAGGLYTDVLTHAGATNITPVSEMPEGEYYAQMSPEVVAQRNPRAIVFTYLDDDGKAATEQYLRTTFGRTDAVRENRLIGVPETAFSGGVHAVPGIEDLAKALHPDAF